MSNAPHEPPTSPTRRLQELGLVLPRPWAITPTAHARFVRVTGKRVMISGHLPIDDEGKLSPPFGKVGAEVSEGEAIAIARRVMLGIFSSLVREIGSLDRIGRWVQLFGMVNAAPGFHGFPAVVDGASILVNEVFGEAGQHSRIAIGVAGLPFNAPLEVQAELELA